MAVNRWKSRWEVDDETRAEAENIPAGYRL